MAAQIHFGRGREPAESVAITLGHEKGGFRQIVLVGDGAQQIIIEPFGQRHDGGRIALEQLLGKGIDLVELEFHCRDSG